MIRNLAGVICFRPRPHFASFSLLLPLELLDLLALVLKLLLLLCELTLGLLVPDHLILQLIANHGAASRAQTASNSCTRGGMAHSGTDYRARSGAKQRSHSRSLFALGQRLSTACGYQQHGCQHQRSSYDL
jgi:hypothetical protein